jgi:hypothetical protein
VFGGSELPEDDTADPDAPVIRLTGMVLFGGVSVSRRAAGEKRRRRDRHRDVHELHRRRHEELRELHREHRDARRERLRELRAERRRLR